MMTITGITFKQISKFFAGSMGKHRVGGGVVGGGHCVLQIHISGFHFIFREVV